MNREWRRRQVFCFWICEMRRLGCMSRGDKDAVMRWVGFVCTSRQREEEAGFEMAVLQRKICVFFPVKGSKGSEGSKCLYSFESCRFRFSSSSHR
jgi:hypothetical protein